MNSEEFTIYGIFSVKEAKGFIDSDKFRHLMVDYLTVFSQFFCPINFNPVRTNVLCDNSSSQGTREL